MLPLVEKSHWTLRSKIPKTEPFKELVILAREMIEFIKEKRALGLAVNQMGFL